MIYTNIRTLPLGRYFDIIDTHDLTYLVISGDHKHSELIAAWDDIKAEITDAIGVNDVQLTALRMQSDIAITRAELLLTHDEDLINQLNVRIEEYNEFRGQAEQSTEGYNVYDQLAILEKHFGFQFNLTSTTVLQYLSYQRVFKQQLKQAQNGRESN